MQESTSTPVASIAQRVEAELVRQGYQDLPAAVSVTVVVTLGLGWILGEELGHPTAWLWAAVMGCLIASRAATVFLYRRNERTREDQCRWKWYFIAGAATTGLGWGYASWVFYPILGDVGLPLLILVIAGITAGATRSLGPVLPACWCFQAFSLVPLIIRALQQTQTSAHQFMGLLAILYLFFIMAMARSYHLSLSRSFRLGIESAVLTDQLKEEKRQAEALNRELSAEVAQRRQAESDLRAAKERAENANQAKSDFLAAMSHEIRTPMNGVLGMLDLLNTPALTPAQREQVETASASAESLLLLINDILDFSKLDSNRLDFESTPFRPALVAEQTVTLMQPRAAAKSLGLRCTVDESARFRVMGDAMRFRQVLLTLVGSAVKFCDHGELELAVSGGQEVGGRIRLTVHVRGHGVGLDTAARARLAAPFAGLGSLDRQPSDAGLGRAIAQRLVLGMGGAIMAPEGLGPDALFGFQLPLPLARDRDTHLPFIGRQGLPKHFNARVLIVEDDATNQRVLALMLQRFGLQYHIVPDGSAALGALRAGEWDLVFMDCQLPGIDGLETTRRARLLLGEQELPIVALTSSARSEDRAACLSAGMDDFIAKPVRSEALQACLARWLHPDG